LVKRIWRDVTGPRCCLCALQAQDNIIELNKSRLRALDELKAARQKIAELGALPSGDAHTDGPLLLLPLAGLHEWLLPLC
jgi:hypothetical protein